MSLDLGTAEGREVLADLIRWADVYGESFSPGVIDRMGFGYEAAQRLNPDIIMVSSSLLGQTGPWREYAGFGNLAGAVCGFYQLAGMPDAPPVGAFGPYTDFMGGALQRDRDPCRARAPRPYRRRTVHRHGAGGGGAAFPRAGGARVSGSEHRAANAR